MVGPLQPSIHTEHSGALTLTGPGRAGEQPRLYCVTTGCVATAGDMLLLET